MKVKELISLLQEENPESNVYGVDWSNGITYGISIGKDDEDMEDDVYIELIDI